MGKNWKKRKLLEELGKIGRIERIKKIVKIDKIDKIWNLDFVSLNRPDTC